MAMAKKLAILVVAGLAIGATACSSSGTDTAASTTTEAPTTTTEKDTTTTADDESTTTKVTRPATVEKIDKAQLPADTPSLPTSFDITADEQDCVYTVIYEYSQDPSNAQDDATLAGVTGGAMAACIDQDKLAAGITASVADAAPQLTATQLSCLETEIAAADTQSLSIFLGAFIYEGPGAKELQQPFLTALDEACGLST